MAMDIIIPIRILSLLLALAELGLISYVIHYTNTHYYQDPFGYWVADHNTPIEAGILLFVSIWTLFALPYLTLAHKYLVNGDPFASSSRRHKTAILSLDVIAALLWLGAWVPMSELMSGTADCPVFCATIQATVIIGGVLWLLFSGMASMEGWRCWKAKKQTCAKQAVEDDLYFNASPQSSGVTLVKNSKQSSLDKF